MNNLINILNKQCSRPINFVQLSSVDQLLKDQTSEYFVLFDQIANNLDSSDQKHILIENNQFVPQNKTERLHHVTYILLFGSLQPCSECGTRSLVCVNNTYLCSHLTAWSKCSNIEKEPRRNVTIIPPTLLGKYPFLTANRPIRTRALHSFRSSDEYGQDLILA